MGKINIRLEDDVEDAFRKAIVSKFGLKQGVINQACNEAIRDVRRSYVGRNPSCQGYPPSCAAVATDCVNNDFMECGRSVSLNLNGSAPCWNTILRSRPAPF